MTKPTPDYIKNITELLSTHTIAPYMRDEITKIIGYMNVYRVENMYVNRDFLLEYLTFIDRKNSLMLAQYMGNKHWNIEWLDYYYNDEYLQKTYYSDTYADRVVDTLWFVNTITAMRGYILLTIEEFCHSTPTRIAINRLLLSKQKRKKESTFIS